MRLPDPPLLVVTDRRQARGTLEEVLRAIFAAGCRWASLREKDLPASEQVDLARRILPLARHYGAVLTLHGTAQLALEVPLDGVHLPAGADPAEARALLGARALIGISVHSRAEGERLDPALIDYALAGPFFETASKPHYGPALERAGFAAIAAAAKVPLLAIGGLAPQNAAAALEAGAAGIAVMGNVMRASDPETEMRQLLAALSGGRA